jgi:hypothetical protein
VIVGVYAVAMWKEQQGAEIVPRRRAMRVGTNGAIRPLFLTILAAYVASGQPGWRRALPWIRSAAGRANDPDIPYGRPRTRTHAQMLVDDDQDGQTWVDLFPQALERAYRTTLPAPLATLIRFYDLVVVDHGRAVAELTPMFAEELAAVVQAVLPAAVRNPWHDTLQEFADILQTAAARRGSWRIG